LTNSFLVAIVVDVRLSTERDRGKYGNEIWIFQNYWNIIGAM
jgi:hypothetical protein